MDAEAWAFLGKAIALGAFVVALAMVASGRGDWQPYGSRPEDKDDEDDSDDSG